MPRIARFEKRTYASPLNTKLEVAALESRHQVLDTQSIELTARSRQLLQQGETSLSDASAQKGRLRPHVVCEGGALYTRTDENNRLLSKFFPSKLAVTAETINEHVRTTADEMRPEDVQLTDRSAGRVETITGRYEVHS